MSRILKQLFRDTKKPPEVTLPEATPAPVQKKPTHRLLPFLTLATLGAGGLLFSKPTLFINLLSNRTPASEAPVEATPAPQLDAEQERENQEAIKHFHAGSYEEASKRFTQLSKENPTSSAILSNLALVEKRQGRLMDARNRTLAAIQLNPKNAVAKNNLGTLAAEEKRWDESIQILEESIKLDPQLSEPYLNLGKVYELKEQWADAINAYVKYLGHPAGDPIIKKLLKKRVAKLNSLAHVDKEQSP